MAETLFLRADEPGLKKAAEIIRAGGTVIFPTETVYGLGADALNPSAVNKIYAAKGRPGDNPLIVHIYSTKQLEDLVSEVPEDAQKLIDAFWPGPLTIILKKSKDVPYNVTAGLDTVGIRMPSNSIAADFLRCADIPVAAPSANISGKPSPTEFIHCVDDMDKRVDAIIDGGTCSVGVESTVIDMSNTPTIYRPGDITKSQIEDVLGCSVNTVCEVKPGEKAKSPGLKYKHYAPKAPVVILCGDAESIAAAVKRCGAYAGIITFDEYADEFKNELSSDAKVISLGGINSPKTAEARLFSCLRRLDGLGAEIIIAPEIPESDNWLAVRNRLYRAAGNCVFRADDYDFSQIK